MLKRRRLCVRKGSVERFTTTFLPFTAERCFSSQLSTSVLCRISGNGRGGSAATRQLRGSLASSGSACVAAPRFLATEADRGGGDGTAQAPAWQRLVRLLTSSDETGSASAAFAAAPSRMSFAAGADAVWRRSSSLRCLWNEAYHPAFQRESATSAFSSSLLQHGRARAPSVASSVVCPQETKECSARARTSFPHYRETTSAGCFPNEAEDLPIFVQALGQLGTALNARISGRTTGKNGRAVTSSTASDAGEEALSVEELCVWLSEVQAVLLYTARYKLRFLIPVEFGKETAAPSPLPPADAATAAAAQVPAPAPAVNAASYTEDASADRIASSRWTHSEEDDFDEDVMEERTVLAASADQETQLQPRQPQPPSLRQISRLADERLRHKAPPLASDELLRVIVLIEAARTILEVAAPPPLASSVRAELYTVLLSVVGASEQLSSSALASLTTCLARCVDSYTTCQQLHRLRPGAATRVTGDSSLDDTCTPAAEEGGLRYFFRPVLWDNSSTSARAPVMHASLLERDEAAQLTQHRGGLNNMLKPTEVLQQLSVLANVAQHRLARSLRVLEQNEKFMSAPPGGGRSLHANAAPVLRIHTYHSSTASLAQQERIEEGLLGLLSLEERKARQAAIMVTADKQPCKKCVRSSDDGDSAKRVSAAAARPRRTIAVIQAEARQKMTEPPPTAAETKSDARPHDGAALSTRPSDSSLSSADNQDFAVQQAGGASVPHAFPTTDVALTDVAEICTALAAMGYRGGGRASSAEEPLWALVTDFTCAEIEAVANARDALLAVSASHAPVDELNEDETAKETTVQQLIQDVRDIVFALDRVGCTSGYDQVMSRLVARAFLTAPIPAPSAGVRVMREVDGAKVDGA